jgi:hypothetical protein
MSESLTEAVHSVPPSGSPMYRIHGQIVGLRAFASLAGDVLPAVAGEAYRWRQGARKGFNDAPVPVTVGERNGRPIRSPSTTDSEE